MINFEEYRFMRKLEKDNMSQEMLSYAVQPSFVKRLHETLVIDYIKANDTQKDELVIKTELEKARKEMKNYYSKKIYNNFKLICRLEDRKLIKLHEEIIKVEKENINTVVRIYRITDLGYNAIIEYRNGYKFWVPLLISLASITIAII